MCPLWEVTLTLTVISSLLDTLLTPSCSSPSPSVTINPSVAISWFPFQLCLTSLSSLGVLSEPQIYFPSLLKSPQRKSLLMPQFPYFNFLLPERRSFLPKKVKSAKKTPSHPNINLNRQLDGSPDWQKDLQNQHDSFSSQISQTNISSFFLPLTVWQTPHPWRDSRDNIPHWRPITPLYFGAKPNFISLKAEKIPGYETFTLDEHIRWVRDVCKTRQRCLSEQSLTWSTTLTVQRSVCRNRDQVKVIPKLSWLDQFLKVWTS